MTEDRKTFTIPPGYEAVRDGEGRATGEVRPCSAATTGPLLPCPFCGSQSIDPAFWATADYCGPGCDACGATAETSEKWNARSEGARDFVDRAIHSFTHDPADNAFQRGFLAALEFVRKEAFDAR